MVPLWAPYCGVGYLKPSKNVNNQKQKETMSHVTFEELLEAGSHFGHLTRKWNPAMAPYIFKEMNGIHIIDLHKTVVKLEEATAAARKLAAQGRTILFVGTKKQAQAPVAEAAQACGMPYVTERWPGGCLPTSQQYAVQ